MYGKLSILGIGKIMTATRQAGTCPYTMAGIDTFLFLYLLAILFQTACKIAENKTKKKTVLFINNYFYCDVQAPSIGMFEPVI